MKPLRFHPILKRLRWGGRRLGTELHKPIGEGRDYAESWELSDHGDDQSVVAAGPHSGWTLRRLIREHGAELLGRHGGLREFPLLFKFLDATDRLSVQVHPNDEQARARDPGGRGKTEAWVVLDALPGSCIYAGLNPDVTRASLETAVREGTVEDCLHRIPVARGDCAFIPAGTVHAVGEGVLLAEVQQSSDLTYRLFDWDRRGADGRPRELHIEDSLACMNFDGPVPLVRPLARSAGPSHMVETLASCAYFTLLRHVADKPFELANDDRCHVLMGIDGSLRIGGDDALILDRGATLLVPAAALPIKVEPRESAIFLETCWD